MQSLHIDILYNEIFDLLSLNDIYSIIKINKYFNQILMVDPFWKTRFILDFGEKLNKPDTDNFLTYYKNNFIEYKNKKKSVYDDFEFAIKNEYVGLLTIVLNNSNNKSWTQKIISNLFHNYDYEKENIIKCAIVSDNPDILKLLHKNNFDILLENRCEPSLYIACINEKMNSFKYLVENGANLNKLHNDWYLLYKLSISNKYKIVKFLLENNLIKPVDFVNDENDCSSLYIASQQNSYETACLLIDYGASIKIEYKGYTPLYVACMKNNWRIVDYILNKPNLFKNENEKLDYINKPNNDYSTCLYVACQNGCTETVKILLQYKINTECLFMFYTPLFIATYYNYDKIVEMLCIAGADINITYQNNKNVYLIAFLNQNKEIMAILDKYKNYQIKN